MSEMLAKERLRALRKRAGWSVRNFAKAIGFGERFSSYSSYETKYKKKFLPLDLVKRIFPSLAGRGEPPIMEEEIWALAGICPDLMGIKDEVERNRRVTDKCDLSSSVVIREYDVGSQAGNGALVVENDGEEDSHFALAFWKIPRNFLESYITDVSGLAVVRVMGNSMEPDFSPGERVLVDTNHKSPYPDGVYILWNGLGVVIKQLQFVPQTDPPRIRIISLNQSYPSDEVLLSAIHINGRVIGKWVWK